MKYLTYIFLFLGVICTAQKERIQIKGIINTDLSTPLTGITIFNGNSLEGTVTNDKGFFYIDAMEGDELSFKAIQFETFSLKVSNQVIEDKKIELSLNADVKDLEVVNVNATSFMIPVKRVETVDAGLGAVAPENIKTAGVDRMEYTFSDKVRKGEEYAVRSEAFKQTGLRYSMVGFSNYVNTASIAERLDSKNVNKDDSIPSEKNPLVLLKNKYSKDYLIEYLKIDEKDFIEYGYFVEDHGLTLELVQSENELELLEFLSQKATAFKKRKNKTNE
ncbi:MAG: carboxypeptidase-like regulatory domain-containing protein [Nonlabens sp.]|uniref:carboxypeptidase-like regulatory domain-containing protein n=1 Tax=Nonlabens sp. TaxID=1888209 RepID=UPI003EF456E6